MQENHLDSVDINNTEQLFIQFERESCDHYSPIVGLDGELDESESGKLVLIDDNSECIEVVGIWSGKKLPGQDIVSLVAEPLPGKEIYFTDKGELELPLVAINNGVVWTGEYKKDANTSRIEEWFSFNESANEKVQAALEAVPSAENGFQQAFLDGRVLYTVIIDTEDEDGDGDNSDMLIVGMKHENGVRSLDFGGDGSFEVTNESYTIVDGVINVVDQDGATETLTISYADAKYIALEGGDPHDGGEIYYTLEDAQDSISAFTQP
jgi:hypothetical protein